MEADKCIWLFAINCMKANLDKFLAILLNCESEGSHCLNVNGCSIEPSEEVTLLGVRLDNRLVSKHHTNELCNKTERQVNDLKRLCHHISPALRYVTNVYKSDYRSFLLCQTSLHYLEEGRQQQIAIQTSKMVNNFSPPYLRGLITPQKFTRIHRNYVKTLEIPFYNRVRHGTNSFSFFGIWNNLQGGNPYTI